MSGAYYLSRLKMNTKLFQKNETSKKKYQYTLMDLEAIMEQLQPGELYEIPIVYIGHDYLLPVRAVIYHFSQEDAFLKEREGSQSSE